MKKLLLSLALAASLGAFAQSSLPEWQDVSVTQVGREKPRSYFMTYNNRAEAVTNDFKASSYYMDLNGKWRFLYLKDHRQLPDGVEKAQYNDSQWDWINVPTNWELQGYGNAIYTNHGYEFKPKNPTPPQLPDAVEMGVYRTKFDLPLQWRDRDIFLHIGGIKSGAYIFINGRKVGYTEDSKSAAEFRINDYVKEGENSLVFEVYRWSTGSYLECQDFWRVSGIERDVYIYSQPKTHIEDYFVTATLDESYTDGLFKVEMVVVNDFVRRSGDLQVWFELEDDKGELVQYNYKEMFIDAKGRDTVVLERKIPNVRKWSAEDPYLYTLVMKIKEGGKFTEYISQKVGFRTSEVKGNQYLVNGKRVFVKGVNYHETHPVTGHYVDEATLIKDMELMKQANINAIRLCHYPQQRRFFELADKYGFYVCNEANIESHGMYYDLRKGGSLGNNPDWLNKHMDRTQNMYYQAKNYPSVMFWSLGNESGNGYNFYETYLWLKSVDKSRPVQYERALLEWNTDIFCPQYPGAKAFKEWGEMETDRPYIASEYAHAMGNSTGNFCNLWDEIYKYKNLQGGFIWDWVDQGFMAQNADSTEYWWTYGGDYGVNSPSDGNFLANGIVSPDRIAHPGWSEVKKVHQYVQFSEIDGKNGVYEVKNIYDFTPLSKFNIVATIYANGKVVSSQPITLSTAPDETDKVTVKGVKELKPTTGVEYFVVLSVKLKEDDGLLKKGFEVANEQFVLPIEPIKTEYANKAGALKYSLEGNDMIFTGRSFNVIIDKTSGLINSYSVNGNQLLYNDYAIRPNFWRAPTDNDFGSRFPADQAQWRDLSLGTIKAKSVNQSDVNEGCKRVVATFNLPDQTTLTLTYTIYSSGIVNVDYNFKGNTQTKRQLFRQGMRLRMPEAYSSIEYFGRGPVENYCDRKWATNVGIYNSNAKLEGVDYVRPQECGHHTDTRYVALTKGVKGSGLAVIAGDMIEFNALNAAVEDYDAESSKKPYQWSNFVTEVKDEKAAYMSKPRQTHINDVKEQPFVEINIDGRMMGVGGDDSWYSRPYEQYLINANEDFNYNFTLVPIRNTGEISKNLGLNF